jgi:hypothetical protein
VDEDDGEGIGPGAGEYRRQHGDAEHPSHLSEGVVGAGGNADLFARDRGRDFGGQVGNTRDMPTPATPRAAPSSPKATWVVAMAATQARP